MNPVLLAHNLNVPINLAVSPETNARIEQLARSIGVTKEEVFSLAMALLSVAVEAKSEGNQVAVVDPKGAIVTEITGL